MTVSSLTEKPGFLYAAAFLAGMTAGVPVTCLGIGWLAWGAFVPLAFLCEWLITAERPFSGKTVFFWWRVGLLFFLGYGLVTYVWFWEMLDSASVGLSPLAMVGVVLVAWLGIPLMQAIGYACVIPLLVGIGRTDRMRDRPVLRALLAASLWTIGEWIQNFGWFGVPWSKAAISQTGMPLLLQGAAFVGGYGVSFLILFVNFLLGAAMMRPAARRVCLAAALVVFGVNAVLGFWRLQTYAAPDKTVSVGIVQGNVASTDKWANGSREAVFRRYADGTRAAAAAGASYVLWPETALPFVAAQDKTVDAALTDLAREEEVTLIVGTFAAGERGDSNALCVYTAEGGQTVYAKRHLVPFGEYVPMRGLLTTIFPFLGEINLLSEDLSAGTDPGGYTDETASFGCLICFDSIYEKLARDSVRAGAEVLLLSTNDSWFGTSAGIYMHAAQAVLRAVENGRSVVRAANTGLSETITPMGQVTETLPVRQTGVLVESVAVTDAPTWYTRIGHLFVYACMLFAIVCTAAAVLPGRRVSRKIK